MYADVNGTMATSCTVVRLVYTTLPTLWSPALSCARNADPVAICWQASPHAGPR